jgi:hypothetical protein
MDFNEFLVWEYQTKDTIDFKKMYVDIAGDLVAGLVLSEIIYWYLPSMTDGNSKLRVLKEGKYWIARRRYDWWDRARLSPKQADRALKSLEENGLIEKRIFKFKGEPTIHIRLQQDTFVKKLDLLVKKPLSNPFSPKGEDEIDSTSETEILETAILEQPNKETPYTQSTPESSSENLKQKNISWLPSDEGKQDEEFDEEKEQTSDGEEVAMKDEIDEAIMAAWGIYAPGRVQQIKTTLLGLHPVGSEHYINNVTPPAKAYEIQHLAEIYGRTNPDIKMPTAPAKIQDWLYKVREYRYGYVERKGFTIPVKVKVPPECDTPRKTWNYVKKFYRDEADRLEALFEEIDSRVETKPEMDINNVYQFKGETITINVPIPKEAKTWGQTLEYLRKHYPGEADCVQAELNRIIKSREEELEAILKPV